MNIHLRPIDATEAMRGAVALSGRVDTEATRLLVADQGLARPGWTRFKPGEPELAPSEHAYIAAVNVGVALTDYHRLFRAAGLAESAWPARTAKVTVNGFNGRDNARSLFNPRRVGHVSFDRTTREQPFWFDAMVARHEAAHLLVDQLSRTASHSHRSMAVNEGLADSLAVLSAHLSGDLPKDDWRVVIRDIKEIAEQGTTDGERYITRVSEYDRRSKPHKSGPIISAAIYRMHAAGIPEQRLSDLLMQVIADPRMSVRPAKGQHLLTFERTGELHLHHARALWPRRDGHADIVRRELQAAEMIA